MNSRDRIFPDEVILQILARLPVKSLFRAKTVCKLWYRISSDKYFIQLYNETAAKTPVVLLEISDSSESKSSLICIDNLRGVSEFSLDFLKDRVKVRASSNGLLCCSSIPDKGVYYVCNPMTRESKLLPKSRERPVTRFYPDGEATLVGLACNLSMQKFNVVLAGYHRTFGHRPDGTFLCLVFDSDLNKWNPNLVSLISRSLSNQKPKMSHFGRSGPPDISDTYSLLVLNITFRTTADDLFPLFDKYGKVVDIFIPRDRRTGDSRGFAFVRYKYADEAQKAVERLDGRVVDGREITVQFAKYGPNAERIHKGRIIEPVPRSRHKSRSRSPRRRYRDDHKDRDHRRRSRSRSLDRYDRDRYRGRDKDYRRRSRSRSASPDYSRGRGRGRYDDERRSSSRSVDSASPVRRSPSPRSSSPRKNSPSKGESPDRRSRDGRSPTPRSASPRGRPAASRSRSASPRNSDVDE